MSVLGDPAQLVLPSELSGYVTDLCSRRWTHRLFILTVCGNSAAHRGAQKAHGVGTEGLVELGKLEDYIHPLDNLGLFESLLSRHLESRLFRR